MCIHVEHYTPQGKYLHYVGVAKSLHIRLHLVVFCYLALEQQSLKTSQGRFYHVLLQAFALF